MASSQSMFSSFEYHSSPHILMANNTCMHVCEKGSIDMDDQEFKDISFIHYQPLSFLSIRSYMVKKERVWSSHHIMSPFNIYIEKYTFNYGDWSPTSSLHRLSFSSYSSFS